MTIQDLNNMDQRELRDLLYTCCGSQGWSKIMMMHFPTDSFEELIENAEEEWKECSEDEWKEAFTQHPRIGDLQALREKFSNGREAGEQAGVVNAPDEVLEELARANREYEDKFGYIFIISAAGKSAAQILKNLRERLNNTPETELQTAAAEQMKITRLRLERLLGQPEKN